MKPISLNIVQHQPAKKVTKFMIAVCVGWLAYRWYRKEDGQCSLVLWSVMVNSAEME